MGYFWIIVSIFWANYCDNLNEQNLRCVSMIVSKTLWNLLENKCQIFSFFSFIFLGSFWSHTHVSARPTTCDDAQRFDKALYQYQWVRCHEDFEHSLKIWLNKQTFITYPILHVSHWLMVKMFNIGQNNNIWHYLAATAMTWATRCSTTWLCCSGLTTCGRQQPRPLRKRCTRRASRTASISSRTRAYLRKVRGGWVIALYFTGWSRPWKTAIGEAKLKGTGEETRVK